MRTSAASLFGAVGVIACCVSCASAFVVPSVAVRASPAASARQALAAAPSSRRTTTLSAEKEGEGGEQEPMDLDLEQMFEVFDAADKEVSDEEVGKKGGDKKTAGDAKDPAEAMGDMLSSFFGGGKK